MRIIVLTLTTLLVGCTSVRPTVKSLDLDTGNNDVFAQATLQYYTDQDSVNIDESRECMNDARDAGETTFNGLLAYMAANCFDPCHNLTIPPQDTTLGTYDCTASNERVDTANVYFCTAGNIGVTKTPFGTPIPDVCFSPADVNESAHYTTNPNISNNWNNWHTSPCPMWGDFELCATVDLTTGNLQSVVNAGATGSVLGTFGFNVRILGTVMQYRTIHNGASAAFTDFAAGINELCITRVGTAMEYKVDGVVVRAETNGNNNEVYFNLQLFGNGNTNSFGQGTHVWTDIDYCPL